MNVYVKDVEAAKYAEDFGLDVFLRDFLRIKGDNWKIKIYHGRQGDVFL